MNLKKIYIILILVILISSCKSKEILLPDNEIITSDMSIKDIENKYNVLFYQYEGFKGRIDDEILSDFDIDINFQPLDVVEDDKIEKLKNCKIKGISFEVLSSLMGTEELVLYVQRLYPKSIVVKLDNVKYLIKDSSGKQICSIEYVEFGIPGCFIQFSF